MSRLPLLVSLLAVLSAPAVFADGANDPKKVQLEVGEQTSLGFLSAPICDNPKVAVLSADGEGVLRAVGEGETLCSGETAMRLRQVYKVVVTAPAESEIGKPPRAR